MAKYRLLLVSVQLVARQGRSKGACVLRLRHGQSESLYSGLARPNLTTSIPCVAQLGLLRTLPTNHCLLRQTSAVAPRFQGCPSVSSESVHPPGAIPTSDSK